MRNKPILALVIVIAITLGACAGGGYSSSETTQAWRTEPYEAPPPPPSPEPYPDVYYDNPGVNPPTDSQWDAVSTFALDVDTASYTVARRYVTDGNLPDRDSVRVEEFVNFFAQDYPTPRLEDGLSLVVDGGSTPYVHGPQNRVVRIGVQAAEVSDRERPDANLVFVIDTSGSMAQDNRLQLVKQSLLTLVSNLNPNDTIGIVEYGSHARVVLHPTPVWEERDIWRAIDGLSPDGSTNAAEGLKLGYEMAAWAFERGGINRVILCSDGVANVGPATDPEGILALIAKDAERGIEMVSVGFGMGNYNDIVMEQLADQGDGFYAYVDTIEEAERIFVDDLSGTLLTIASEAKIQVEFDPQSVETWRLIGYENRALSDNDFRDDSVDAGEIGAGHTVTALYEVRPTAEAVEDPNRRLATVKLRWTDTATGEKRELGHNVTMADLAPGFGATAARFQQDVLVAQYAEILRRSVQADQADDGLDELALQVGRLEELLPRDDDVAEFVDLLRQAAWIAGG